MRCAGSRCCAGVRRQVRRVARDRRRSRHPIGDGEGAVIYGCDDGMCDRRTHDGGSMGARAVGRHMAGSSVDATGMVVDGTVTNHKVVAPMGV